MGGDFLDPSEIVGEPWTAKSLLTATKPQKRSYGNLHLVCHHGRLGTRHSATFHQTQPTKTVWRSIKPFETVAFSLTKLVSTSWRFKSMTWCAICLNRNWSNLRTRWRPSPKRTVSRMGYGRR